MKAEYADERDNNSRSQNPNPQPLPPTMFSKFQHQPPEQQHPHPEYRPPMKKARSDDGGTIEAVRRPRGRPPGSKNKPKPATVITREAPSPPSSMAPYILEIPAGADVAGSLVRIAERRGMGLCVLSGTGAVANVTLLQPAGGGSGTVTFHGRFEMASLAGVVLPEGRGGGPFTVTLSAPQGHVVGGKVAGALLAAGTVYVVAAGFSNPTFHKLPLAEEDGAQEVGESGSVGEDMYGCQVGGPDVVWPPPPY